MLRKSGRVDSIGEPGTLLGALPSVVLADTEGDLGVGDTLVLYTDGVLDVGDRSKSDDPDWLIRELPIRRPERRRDRREPRPGGDQRHGGEPRDDIAVLVLHRNGSQ